MNKKLKSFKKHHRFKRFRKLHHYFKRKYGKSTTVRLIAIFIGIFFILIGIILLFIPGPGLLFLILGIGLISLSSIKLARFLDKIEFRLHQLYKKYIKKSK